jgi:hypothetical protein
MSGMSSSVRSRLGFTLGVVGELGWGDRVGTAVRHTYSVASSQPDASGW